MASGSSTANLPGSISGQWMAIASEPLSTRCRCGGNAAGPSSISPRIVLEAGHPAEPRVWQLDQTLRADTIAIGDLALCRVLLNDDGNYPWLILVPRRDGLVELTDLDESGRTTLMQEIAQVSAALKTHTRCHKLNVAALGNVVAQLHVHIIARFRTDPAWPNPVWGKVKRIPYEQEQRDMLADAMRRALQIGALQG